MRVRSESKQHIPAVYQGRLLNGNKRGVKAGTSTLGRPYLWHFECYSVSPALHNNSFGVNGVIGVYLSYLSHILYGLISDSSSINSVLIGIFSYLRERKSNTSLVSLKFVFQVLFPVYTMT